MFGLYKEAPGGPPLSHILLELQELLIGWLAGWAGIIVAVVVTAGFLPNMVRSGTVDMLLVKPLAAGETATLEYSASFHYPAPPPPEFRRIVQYFVENLDIRVEFHPGKLPTTVEWAVWDGMDGPIVERERVTLDSQFAVHRYLRLAEKTAVGFHWDW